MKDLEQEQIERTERRVKKELKKELNNINKINNLLITYAYRVADDIRLETNEIRNRILRDQPNSEEKNHALIIGSKADYIINQAKLLKKLSNQSVNLYRFDNNLDEDLISK